MTDDERIVAEDEMIASHVRWLRSCCPMDPVDAVRALLARLLVSVGGALILVAVLVGPLPRKDRT